MKKFFIMCLVAILFISCNSNDYKNIIPLSELNGTLEENAKTLADGINITDEQAKGLLENTDALHELNATMDARKIW